jgi:hypothetical protein
MGQVVLVNDDLGFNLRIIGVSQNVGNPSLRPRLCVGYWVISATTSWICVLRLISA